MPLSEMRIIFPGRKRVSAQFQGFEVATDQPAPNGEGSAPAPFDLFLAYLGTCAGIFAIAFCQKRGISTEGLEIMQKMEWSAERHHVTKVTMEVQLPAGFPAQYRDALVTAVNLCSVKKHLAEPPAFDVVTLDPAATPATP